MTLFTSQSAATFCDKLFSSLDFTLPRAATGRRGFPKEAMVCAFIVMKCEGFSQITDLMDYLDNNRLIAHYCGFNIMEPLPSYRTYDRFLRQLDNGALKAIMADLVRQLYELGIVDASFVGLDSTPVMANTMQNNPKSFAKSKFSKENHHKSGAVDKVSLCSALPTKKDAHWRHPAYFIIRFRFNAVADKRQWSSAASKPRRKTRAKLCSRFCAENEPSHQTCRSFSASRYSGLERRSRLRCRSAAK